jgi:ABC-type multidrug transport system ATPase subunit
MAGELCWKNIRYTISCEVKKGGQQQRVVKEVLNDINGKAVEGRFFAILGPTGSGKTSLLNVLADRIKRTKNAVLEGNVTYAGRTPSSNIMDIKASAQSRKQYQSISAYVTQDECLFTFLTVKETVLLTAKFHYSPISKDEELQVNERVEELIRTLGLEGVSDTLVGSPNIRGISGGERKRTAIAKELVSDPEILFLDEPTSGKRSATVLPDCLCAYLSINIHITSSSTSFSSLIPFVTVNIALTNQVWMPFKPKQ